jgi:hypothetical protein
MQGHIVNRDAQRRRETVERLFAACDGTLTVEQHAAVVKQALDSSFHADVDQLVDFLTRSGIPSDRAVTVTDLARAHGGDVVRAFARHRLHREAMRRSISGYFLGLVDLGAYLAALVLVLACIVLLYSVFVFPQLEALFADVGGSLPALTAGIFKLPWVPWVLVLLFASLVFLSWRFSIRLRDGLYESRPLDNRWALLPPLRTVLERHASLVRLQWLDALLAGNLELVAAHGAVTERIGGLGAESLAFRSLMGASRVGILDLEMRAQIECADEDLLDSLIRTRRVIANGLRGVVYAGIGLFVVAMYLPIFQFGVLA